MTWSQGTCVSLQVDDGDGRHARVDDEVDAADLGQVAQHRPEVRGLIVDVDRRAAEPPQRRLPGRRLLRGLRCRARASPAWPPGRAWSTRAIREWFSSVVLCCRSQHLRVFPAAAPCPGLAECSTNTTPCASMLLITASRSCAARLGDVRLSVGALRGSPSSALPLRDDAGDRHVGEQERRQASVDERRHGDRARRRRASARSGSRTDRGGRRCRRCRRRRRRRRLGPTLVPTWICAAASAASPASARARRSARESNAQVIDVFMAGLPLRTLASGGTAATSFSEHERRRQAVTATLPRPFGLRLGLDVEIGHRDQPRHRGEPIEEAAEVVVAALEAELNRPLGVLRLGDDVAWA